jgi:hypothetical protein
MAPKWEDHLKKRKRLCLRLGEKDEYIKSNFTFDASTS